MPNAEDKNQPNISGHDGVAGSVPLYSNGLIRVSCASVPRSGHHLLQQILREYYGSRHVYCQYYEGPYRQPDCCNTYPCTNPRVNFQKSHDFGLMSNRPKDRYYIIQYRHPIEACISSFEEGLTYKTHMEDTSAYWRDFAWQEVTFFKNFVHHWIFDSDLPHVLMLNYEDVARSPFTAAGSVISFIEPGVEIDRSRLASAIQGLRVGKARGIFAFRYFDLEFLTALESFVSEEIRRLGLPYLLLPKGVKMMEERRKARHLFNSLAAAIPEV